MNNNLFTILYIIASIFCIYELTFNKFINNTDPISHLFIKINTMLQLGESGAA